MSELEDLLDPSRVTAEVPAGAVFDAWRLRKLSREEFGARTIDARLQYLAWLGLLAPTTHNTVPQRFKIDARASEGRGAIEVYLDRTRILPESDPTGRQALVSLGCVVAHLELGAASVGLAAKVEIVAESADRLRPAKAGEPELERVLRVSFAEGAEARGDFLEAMLARKVVRAEFDDRVRLDADLPDALVEIAARREGIELHLLTDAPSLLFLGKFQELADTTVVNRDRFARELGAWLHEDEASDAVGMRGREFGLSPEATRRMRDGLLRRTELLPDEIAGFAKVGNVGMRSSSAVLVLTVAEDDTRSRIEAGRAYEEMALVLQKRGFVTAMHAGITEVDAPNFALRGRLRTRRRPTVVFRAGKALRSEDGARAHAARPRLGDVLM